MKRRKPLGNCLKGERCRFTKHTGKRVQRCIKCKRLNKKIKREKGD